MKTSPPSNAEARPRPTYFPSYRRHLPERKRWEGPAAVIRDATLAPEPPKAAVPSSP
jgi:hypothetical protein